MCFIQDLKALLAKQIIEKQNETKAFLGEHGNTSLGEYTISQAYGGARGIKCMVWETSNLDAEEVYRAARVHALVFLDNTDNDSRGMPHINPHLVQARRI